MNTIATIFHYYRFDTSKQGEAEAHKALCKKLKAQGLKMFHALAEPSKTGLFKPLDGQAVRLETKHLFDNQWYTTPTDTSEKGLRVFDWYEGIYPNKSLKTGYWLEQTTEMCAIRDNTTKCRYCGKQEPAQKGYVFCPRCIDSEYLTESNLHLTRMKAVSDNTNCAPLSQAEREHLLPQYRKAPIHGATERGVARLAKIRQRLKDDCAETIRHATVERDGHLWLMDHGIATGNCIYYDHTNKFSFGWRTPIGPAVLSCLLDVISEFPWPYEIKCDNGRTLEGH